MNDEPEGEIRSCRTQMEEELRSRHVFHSSLGLQPRDFAPPIDSEISAAASAKRGLCTRHNDVCGAAVRLEMKRRSIFPNTTGKWVFPMLAAS